MKHSLTVNKGLLCLLLALAVTGAAGFSFLPAGATERFPATSERCPKADDLIKPDDKAGREIRDALPQLIREAYGEDSRYQNYEVKRIIPLANPEASPTPKSPSNNAAKRSPGNLCSWNCSSRSFCRAPVCRKVRSSWLRPMKDGKFGAAIVKTKAPSLFRALFLMRRSADGPVGRRSRQRNARIESRRLSSPTLRTSALAARTASPAKPAGDRRRTGDRRRQKKTGK